MIHVERFLRKIFPTFARDPLWYVALIAGACAIFWVCTFKIMDRDFWWHITAGKIMFSTHRIIDIDPFAHTREGMKYFASYEWASQILLWLLYRTGGFTAVILFRGLIATTCIATLLTLTKKRRFAYVLLGVWAMVITKGSFLERPQLFTFALFSVALVLAFRFLDAETPQIRRNLAFAFVGLTYVWVNMHGGAALLGCVLVGLLLVHSLTRTLVLHERRWNTGAVMLLIATLACMGASLFLPPNGLNALHYLSQLLHDKTIAFIAEFQPRAWGLYVRELWPFYTLSIASLVVGRRHLVFNGLLLLAFAFLSRQAFRHEVFFVLVSVATCLYQCDRSEHVDAVWAWCRRRSRIVGTFTLVGILLLGRVAYVRSFGFERQENLFGFGQFDLASGAFDFIEREHVGGKMFNTYGIGGYSIYRGYPERKVFVDGRNVDYGFDFLAHTYAAGLDASEWNKITDQFGVTYALIDYDAIRLEGRLPYSAILDGNTDWPLVYLDDWVAVYLKRIPQNQSIIDRYEYKHLTATRLQFQDEFLGETTVDFPAVIKELRRIQEGNPRGIKATVALAKIALQEGRLADVETFVRMAVAAHPYSPEPLAILAGMYVDQEKWQKAADLYTRVLSLAGDNYPNINYNFIARVYAKAGYSWKAWYYRSRNEPLVLPTPSTQSGVTALSSSKQSDLAVNPTADALEYLTQAVTYAEAGKTAEAEEAFRIALTLDPGSADAWNNFCAFSLHEMRIDEAKEACEQAVNIDAEHADAHYNLALVFLKQQSYEDATKEATRAQALGREKEAAELLLFIRKIQLK